MQCCLRQAMPPPHTSTWQGLPAAIVHLEFPRGARIYEEGEPGGWLFNLREGRIKLLHYLPDGRERIVRLLGWGDVAGLESLGQRAYRHTAIAMTPVRGCRIDRAALASLANHPRLHEALMRHWARSLDAADWWIMQLSTGPLKARVARLILHLKQTDEASCAGAIKLPHREEMAAMLDVAAESLCRVIGEFQRQGLLRRIEGSLFAFDPEALRKITIIEGG